MITCSWQRQLRGNSPHARRRGFTVFGLLLVITLCCLLLALVVALRETRSQLDRVLDLMITADGKTVAAVFGDGRTRFLDTQTGRETRSFVPRMMNDNLDFAVARGSAYALSPDGQYLAQATSNPDANGQPIPGIIWEVGAEKEKVRFRPMDVARLRFSPDGRYLAVATSVGATVELVDVATGGVTTLNTRGVPFAGIQGIAFSADGGVLAVASSSAPQSVSIELFDVSTRGVKQAFAVPGHFVQLLTFLRDGKSLVGVASTIGVRGQTAHTLYLWDSATLAVRGAANAPDARYMEISGDGRVAVFGLRDIALFDADALRPVGTIADGHVLRIASAPAANLWATTDGRSIQLRDGRTGRVVKTIWKSRPALSLPLVLAALVAWFVVFSVYRRRTRAKKQSAACSLCGDAPADRGQPAYVCLACRAKQTTAAEQRKRLWRRLATFAVLTFVAGLLYGIIGGPQVAIAVWVGLPAFIAMLWLVIYATNVRRVRRLARVAETFRAVSPDAHESTTQAWDIDRVGHVTSASGGRTPFADRLTEAARLARERLAAIAGTDVEFPPGLKVAHFDRPEELARRTKMFGVDEGLLGCVYVARPARQVICCETAIRRRLADPVDSLCASLTYALLDRRRMTRLPVWLSHGLAISAARRGRDDESQRLNGAVLGHLALGAAFGPEMFRMRLRQLWAHVRQTYNYQEFAYVSRFQAQARSLVQYLTSDAAPSAHRGSFGALVADVHAGKPLRRLRPNRYGMPEEELLAAWKAWVQSRGPGQFSPPNDSQRATLVEHLIPLVRNRQARFIERLRAIRTMGGSGFLTGADALVDLLAEPDEDVNLRMHARLALVLVAGEDHGPQADGWHAWWAELPETWKAAVPATV